jgi:hypothetical protein
MRTSPDVSMTDARALNWRFVVPSEPPGLLLLAEDGGRYDTAVTAVLGSLRIDAALRAGPYPAIAATDIGAWAAAENTSSREVLSALAAAVPQGGWIYAGFANAWFPLAPYLPGSLTVCAACGILRRAGLSDIQVFAALPDHRHPGLLVPTSQPEELDHVLRALFLNYQPGDSALAAARRMILRGLRWTAVVLPHRIRAHALPGFGVIGVRPA